jgi:hypothetical protein
MQAPMSWHAPLTQTSLVPQALQAPPSTPQADCSVPERHCPVVSTHPTHEETAQLPVALQMVPLPQAAQVKPFCPHAAAIFPG